jgi:hypothetical protein
MVQSLAQTLCSGQGRDKSFAANPMATHTDGVLRRAGQQASSHNTIQLEPAASSQFSGPPGHAKDALEPLLLESTRPS